MDFDFRVLFSFSSFSLFSFSFLCVSENGVELRICPQYGARISTAKNNRTFSAFLLTEMGSYIGRTVVASFVIIWVFKGSFCKLHEG